MISRKRGGLVEYGGQFSSFRVGRLVVEDETREVDHSTAGKGDKEGFLGVRGVGKKRTLSIQKKRQFGGCLEQEKFQIEFLTNPFHENFHYSICIPSKHQNWL